MKERNIIVQRGSPSRAMPVGAERRPMHVDFGQTPFVVAWEITRACALACQHCRAEAQPRRHPEELTTEQGFALIDEVADMGVPLMILTGGDPMLRDDLPELIAHGGQRGIRMALSPSATPRVTRRRLEACRKAGVGRISISVDGHDATTHDAFRGFPGVFDRTLKILDLISDLGLTVQINTTVCRQNVAAIEPISQLIERLGAVMWSVFFLVPTGRGRLEDVVSAGEHERVFNWLYEYSQTAPFDVRTTAGPQYRRVVVQRSTGSGAKEGEHAHAGFQYSSRADGITRSALGVNDGKGFCFVSHVGEIQPSGFLPLTAGRYPRDSLAAVYRESRLFRELRRPDLLKGKCGACEFRELCGGSRGRAYAFTGDYLASEPRCAYEPKGLPA